ncbi:uncharacterized protein SEPMUDRAFT_120710 [Sphaerulina musiva SO2202]|uniref:Uncharacterized protein n=1 Tax=Sphaerulina musiva (strain SO2202) TaxID=692275 RepID=M3BRS3_SPHMS|nr:uncharacterized protein SEPMUDRAFT_120710 [Sphaerulina musiva SO2202]EMF08813.1 hypothetical protein SEPMUDRAFT_120710 [Sphaerulina musiva SO2202]
MNRDRIHNILLLLPLPRRLSTSLPPSDEDSSILLLLSRERVQTSFAQSTRSTHVRHSIGRGIDIAVRMTVVLAGGWAQCRSDARSELRQYCTPHRIGLHRSGHRSYNPRRIRARKQNLRRPSEKIPNLAPMFTRLFSWVTHAGAPMGAVSSPRLINDPLTIRFVRNGSRRADEPSSLDMQDQCSTEMITTYSVPVLRQCQLERTLGKTARDCESENHSRAV